MCGIVGYAGHRQAADVLIEGLTRLEYRGYDSAGIAVLADGTLASLKRAGKLTNLVKALAAEPPLRGNVGLGHTRWATHGAPTDPNRHGACQHGAGPAGDARGGHAAGLPPAGGGIHPCRRGRPGSRRGGRRPPQLPAGGRPRREGELPRQRRGGVHRLHPQRGGTGPGSGRRDPRGQRARHPV
jgi:hypothetical protein